MLLGSKIKKVRELKNYTQEFMSDKLQMSQSNYSRIESNEVDVPFSKLEQIADVLEIKLTDLVEFDSKYFFNNVNNQTIHGDVNVTVSDKERELYENQIQILKGEVEHLRGVLEKVLSK